MRHLTHVALPALTGIFLTAGALGAAGTGEVQERELTLKVPAEASIQELEIYLDVEGSAAREEQVSDSPDSLLTIGRIRQSLVDFQDANVRKKNRVIDQPVMFYLYSPTSRVADFELTVQVAKTGEGILTEGTTPKQFVIEAIELREFGDARGKVLKRFDDVAFKIGEVNRFGLGLELEAGRTLGVRVWAEKGGKEEMAVQIKANKKGRYPAKILRRDADEGAVAGEGVYNPDIAFSYRGAPTGGKKLMMGNPLERVVEQINNYLKGQTDKSGSVSIPLKVRVQMR